MVRSSEEIRLTCDRGEAIYDALIKDRLSDDQLGKYLAINTQTGEYEIGDSSMAVTDALHARVEGADVYVMRHGRMPTLTIGMSPYIGTMIERGRVRRFDQHFIGMSLLRGSELRMMVEDAGEIEITPFDEL